MDSRMESLLEEVIMVILSWVPTLDLPKLRYVCKRWNNILKDPLFHRLHHSHCLSNLNEDRVLILKRRSKLYMVDIYDKIRPRQIEIGLPQLPGPLSYEFIGSCNGLLCLGSRECLWIFIINPFTHQHVFSPMNLKADRHYVQSWGFGFNEITKSFKVVAVVEKSGNHDEFQVRVCDLGSDGSANWRKIGVTTPLLSKSPAFFFNGRLHWTRLDDGSIRIISFDLAHEEFRPIPIPDSLHGNIIDFDLIVLGGCLCIFNSQGTETPKLHIWVMKQYGIKESWVKEFDTRPLIPRGLNSEVSFYQGEGFGFSRNGGRFFKGLGSVKDGELIAAMCFSGINEEAILFSGPTYDEYRHLQLDRPPHRNGSIIHTLSLNWI